jgi:ribosomal protein S18 acetylase RimI-like enzyme
MENREQNIPGKQMNIRSYELSDLEQIGCLFDEFTLMNATLAYSDNCRSIYLNWLRSIYDNSDFKVLVVEQKSTIIAFALGVIQSNKPLLLPQRIGYIGMFIVHSKFRRRGIGNSLFKSLLDWFVSHKIVEIQLTTEINNDMTGDENMKTSCQYIKPSIAILFLFSLFGCASLFLGSRFYQGKAMPREDVAFLYLTGDCQLGSVTKEGHEKMEFLMWSEARGEILPGNYVLELRYFSKGTYTKTKGDVASMPLNAKAGHVYYIKPKFPSSDKWLPVVIDIANDQDYNKIQDSNPKNVQKKIELYFQGERKPMQESEFHTKGGGVVKRWH